MLVWMLTLFAAANPLVSLPAHDSVQLEVHVDPATTVVFEFDQATPLGPISAVDCDVSYADIPTSVTLYAVSLEYAASEDTSGSTTEGTDTTPHPSRLRTSKTASSTGEARASSSWTRTGRPRWLATTSPTASCARSSKTWRPRSTR